MDHTCYCSFPSRLLDFSWLFVCEVLVCERAGWVSAGLACSGSIGHLVRPCHKGSGMMRRTLLLVFDKARLCQGFCSDFVSPGHFDLFLGLGDSKGGEGHDSLA